MEGGAAMMHTTIFIFFISHIIQLTLQEQSAEPRNSAGAEALAVARRPEEASREKNPAAAGIERLFSVKCSYGRQVRPWSKVVVVVARLLDAVVVVIGARCLLDAVLFVCRFKSGAKVARFFQLEPCIYVYICIYIYTYIDIYNIYIYIYIYIYIHIYISISIVYFYLYLSI